MGTRGLSWPDLYIICGAVGKGHRSRCEAIAELWLGNVVWKAPTDQTKQMVLVDYHEDVVDIIRDLHDDGHLVTHISDDGIHSSADIVVHYQNPVSAHAGERFISLIGPRYFPLGTRFNRTNVEIKLNTVGIALGSAGGNKWQTVESEIVKYGLKPVLLRGLRASQYADIASTVEFAVCSASVSAWEMLAMGKMVFLVNTIPQLAGDLKLLVDQNVAVPFSQKFFEQMIDRELHQKLTTKAKEFVDGQGAIRIVDTMKNMLNQRRKSPAWKS